MIDKPPMNLRCDFCGEEYDYDHISLVLHDNELKHCCDLCLTKCEHYVVDEKTIHQLWSCNDCHKFFKQDIKMFRIEYNKLDGKLSNYFCEHCFAERMAFKNERHL